jgi:hypothetical protein
MRTSRRCWRYRKEKKVYRQSRVAQVAPLVDSWMAQWVPSPRSRLSASIEISTKLVCVNFSGFGWMSVWQAKRDALHVFFKKISGDSPLGEQIHGYTNKLEIIVLPVACRFVGNEQSE